MSLDKVAGWYRSTRNATMLERPHRLAVISNETSPCSSHSAALARCAHTRAPSMHSVHTRAIYARGAHTRAPSTLADLTDAARNRSRASLFIPLLTGLLSRRPILEMAIRLISNEGEGRGESEGPFESVASASITRCARRSDAAFHLRSPDF